ncbi:hypothetical protein CRG98_020614 [Punica granatum]|uniref:Tf2-1-like SH3-like domain-containing protein n=1 Tax=Punica granatum TaxID=22663 RepID=A0A2I0JRS0_PUNGR|nr:hypothetical protein CRG98_020614 [Punica granatum]
MRFGKKGKLSPRYIGSYEILERIEKVAYRLALPPELSRIHNVFHLSMLRKYIPDPSHVLSYQPVELNEDLTYEEEPMEIIDRKERSLGPLDPANYKRGLIGRRTQRNINRDLIDRWTRRNINRDLIGRWTRRNISRGMIGRWTG